MTDERSTMSEISQEPEMPAKSAAPGLSGENLKLLGLMRYWLFGTFLIVVAALTAFFSIFLNRDVWLAIRAGSPIWGLVGLLCLVFYFTYRFYLGRKRQ